MVPFVLHSGTSLFMTGQCSILCLFSLTCVYKEVTFSHSINSVFKSDLCIYSSICSINLVLSFFVIQYVILDVWCAFREKVLWYLFNIILLTSFLVECHSDIGTCVLIKLYLSLCHVTHFVSSMFKGLMYTSLGCNVFCIFLIWILTLMSI